MSNISSVIKVFLLLIASLILGWSIWNVSPFSPLLFIALIPLFVGLKFLQSSIRLGKWYVYLIYIFTFKFLWVAGQVFWLKDVTYDTFFASIITHSFIFSVIQLPAIIAFTKKKNKYPFILFIIGWILFEYLMQTISLLSPFYILGTALGNYPLIIQNYSVIGIEGGTLWILLVNYFLFKLINEFRQKEKQKKNLVSAALVVFVPFLLSVAILFFSGPSSDKLNVAALHTDFNPVNEYYGTHPDVIIDSLWKLSDDIDVNTAVLLWPETVVTNLGWIQELQQNTYVDSLQKKLKKFPSLNLVFGANIHTIPIDSSDERLNFSKEYNFYFYVHNMAFSLNSNDAIDYRSKEIFVPFQEEVPYVRTFPSLKKLITVVGNPNFYSEYENDLDIHRTVGGVEYVPLLCYEICYPLFTAQVSKDVGFIALLGNEHWNTSKKGSLIYFNILRAMAVQTKVPIVKSSNNGISVICSQSGEIIAEKTFHDTGILKGEIKLKEGNTLYSYISGYSYLIALILLPYFFIRKKKTPTL